MCQLRHQLSDQKIESQINLEYRYLYIASQPVDIADRDSGMKCKSSGI